MQKLICLVAVAVLAACSDGHRPDPKDAQDIVNKMAYVKEPKSGLCYGVVMSANSDMSYSYSVVLVPCDKVGLGS